MSSRVSESSIFKNSKKPFFDEMGTRSRGRGNLPLHKGGPSRGLVLGGAGIGKSPILTQNGHLENIDFR